MEFAKTEAQIATLKDAIARASGGTGAYVLFQTGDGTAKAGTDYTAVRQLVYVKAGVQSVAVSVPTIVNPAATGTLTFKAAIASTPAAAVGTASILEQPVTVAWADTPLVEGGWAQVVAPDKGWPKSGYWTENGFVSVAGTVFDYNYTNVYRTPELGEYVYIMPASAGLSWDNRLTYTAKSLATERGDWMILYADALKGVAPANGYVPPKICSVTGWWMVSNTCSNPNPDAATSPPAPVS